ncbi:unnamed protein product [Lepeophtheirus salmonis]|uniref:(salmon louse) hypothetical protein n=1 Tax=Lepeophtheirus salmonis TaxID=72036 RepID=A0A0K2V4M6_LEPSM|nr:unnamed protein product [Lepeophtheirus salmonis]CAF2873844.1 unnamed protein product [Lepeophtheirus salmonis]
MEELQLERTAILLSLLLSMIPSETQGIKCYRCDAIESPRNSCPGTLRRPVDTVRDLRDRGGLYTHCIEIKLRNGTIVHQAPVPASPTCGKFFLHTWEMTLSEKYHTRVRARCCSRDLCNGLTGRAGETHNQSSVFALSLLISYLTVYGLKVS